MTVDQVSDKFAGSLRGNPPVPDGYREYRKSRAGGDLQCFCEALCIPVVKQNSGTSLLCERDAGCLAKMSSIARMSTKTEAKVLDASHVEYWLGLTEPVSGYGIPETGLLPHSPHQLVVHDECPHCATAVELLEDVQMTREGKSRKHGGLEYPSRIYSVPYVGVVSSHQFSLAPMP
jgi:hypothetical protein